jgi:Asp-tRNA(Asn)/Glu-tRNA(Gln) amidotransferase A subunit family amidase
MTTHRNPLAPVAEELRAGERDPVEYAESCLDRIDEADGDVRAFLPEEDRRERVRSAAGDRAEQFGASERPALVGVPVGVKDIFHVGGLATRAGSNVPPEELAGPQADAVSALRSAGALVLGKTVTTEFAYFEPGPTRNPHDLGHTPGGSSSGSAAAVAAGTCPLALGSQTIGSVIRPASFCGVVGVKPTYGRVPMGGVIPVAPSVDHVGFFTQDAAGARLAAGALCRGGTTTSTPSAGPYSGFPTRPTSRRPTRPPGSCSATGSRRCAPPATRSETPTRWPTSRRSTTATTTSSPRRWRCLTTSGTPTTATATPRAPSN